MSSSKEHNVLEATMAADIETLYATIGYAVEQQRLGVAPTDRGSLIEHGQAWIRNMSDSFKQLICSNKDVQKYFGADKPSDNEQRAVILLIADLIASMCGIIPAINVSVLLVKIGIKELCNEYDRRT